MEEKKKSKPSLRAKADKIKDFRCKNLIAVLEQPDDPRNIGTIIRNVNALGVEKAYVVTTKDFLPNDWQEMRSRSKLNAISASAIKWSFVKKFKDSESCLAHLEKNGFIVRGFFAGFVNHHRFHMYFFAFKPFKHAKFIFFPRRNPVIPDKGVGENVDLASVGTIRKGTIITACRCRIKNKLTEYLLCCPNTLTLENHAIG